MPTEAKKNADPVSRRFVSSDSAVRLLATSPRDVARQPHQSADSQHNAGGLGHDVKDARAASLIVGRQRKVELRFDVKHQAGNHHVGADAGRKLLGARSGDAKWNDDHGRNEVGKDRTAAIKSRFVGFGSREQARHACTVKGRILRNRDARGGEGRAVGDRRHQRHHGRIDGKVRGQSAGYDVKSQGDERVGIVRERQAIDGRQKQFRVRRAINAQRGWQRPGRRVLRDLPLRRPFGGVSARFNLHGEDSGRNRSARRSRCAQEKSDACNQQQSRKCN